MIKQLKDRKRCFPLRRNEVGNIVYSALAVLLLASCGKPAKPAVLDHAPEHIISLAPNITETIYALGLGDKLVGVTSYCRYPEAARALPKIGGFGQFNYEAIVTLRPDLVILHKEYDIEKERLASLGIPILETGSYFIADILETIQRIGDACGTKEQANELIQHLQTRIDALRTAPASRPNVLLTFGSGDTGTIHAFGSKCLHTELIEIAGGRNGIEGHLPFVTLSREAVLRLNPDIIIELSEHLEGTRYGKIFSAVNAVKKGKVYVLSNDYTRIPGPRFIQTLDDFSKIIKQNN